MNAEKIAQEIVDIVAPQAGGSAVSIADNNGIIIASSDRRLLGTVYTAQAVHTVVSDGAGTDTAVQAPGGGNLQMDICMPLFVCGTLFGTLLLRGSPNSLNGLPTLARMFAEQYLEHHTKAASDDIHHDIRQQMLRMMVFGTEELLDSFEQLSRVLCVRMHFPMRAVIITGGSGTPGPGLPFDPETVGPLLIKKGLIYPEMDLYGAVDDMFVLLHQIPTPDTVENGGRGKLIYEALSSLLSTPPAVSRGECCLSLRQLPDSCRQALWLCRMNDAGFHDIEDNRTRMKYLMGSGDVMLEQRLIGDMYATLCTRFKPEELVGMMETIMVFCGSEPMLEAAQRLGIHKNTLSYRLKKILSATGLQKDDNFTRWFYLQKLLLCHRARQLKKTL